MKVLVIDSHRSQSSIVQQVSRLGWIVEVAGTGSEGSSLMAQEQYACVIIQELLPDCSAMGLAESLKSKYRVPVVLVVESQSYAIWQEAAKRKIDRVITRKKYGPPLEQQVLLRLLQSDLCKSDQMPVPQLSSVAAEVPAKVPDTNSFFKSDDGIYGDLPATLPDDADDGFIEHLHQEAEHEREDSSKTPDHKETFDCTLGSDDSTHWKKDWRPQVSRSDIKVETFERSGSQRKRVIVFWSKKGGVAKTTTAVSSGVLLHRLGKKVVVVEADEHAESNMRSLLGLVPKSYLEDWGQTTNSWPLQDRITVHEGTGLHVLPSQPRDFSRPEEDRPILPETARDIIKELRQYYDYVLIDAGCGTGPLLRILVDMATDFWVLTTPDRTACGRIKSCNVVSHVKDIRPELPIRLILSRYFAGAGFHQKEALAETGLDKFLKPSDVIVLPEDQLVLKAANVQKPVATNVKSPFTKALLSFLQDEFLVNDSKGQKKESSFFKVVAARAWSIVPGTGFLK